ncbi:eukaryotic peptide chain release factor GTP-binding subunit ERF3A [Diorhabda carinulata]|uniref:eukaryotic peptide chain release factor GTP-binding subunit ERF3A n=1 Tax=Diorhabda carinulata TaxID=1163345 RepID=UPI0025A199BE|nr:eukaryotic peptide chain release factor GTP-binding subunit ERF3A [Diorhabda carinulata]XP_057655679.1 eukaryotic peptide chain release factor GTP-binding subunit ERF3A [Diorhabda carinulata]
MSNNTAPDSWESQADTSSTNNSPQHTADVTAHFSTLNVNAVEFVPSFSFGKAPEVVDKSSPTNSQESNSSPQHNPLLNGNDPDASAERVEVKEPPPIPPADGDASPEGEGGTWEDVADEDSTSASAPPATTPEGDEDEEPSSEEAPIKIKKKNTVKEKPEEDKKEHVNVVFIGHVDAGKSTIGGQIMALTGMVDKRTLEKYEREAREKSRESWYLSWALDTNQEERDKGKTVEVGRAFFETDKKHFTILDAPGHKSFVPNMIGGAAQADLAVLVISARKGEFETGFDRGGQTREHAMLAKTAGVKYLVVLVNKMDDPTVNWDEARYNECKDKILPYLKKLGFILNKDLFFLPCSGQTGQGLKDRVDESICNWYRGEAFIPFIDKLPSLSRKADGPFIMPIVDKYKDMGTVLMGKVESGECKKGQTMLIMPNRTPVTVDMLLSDDDEVSRVVPGENVKVKVKGIEEEDVSPGFVLCDSVNPIHTGRIFDAQLVILEHRSIICAGYSAVMHIHCAAEEVTVKALICLVDKKTGEKSKTRPRFVKQDQVAIMRIECAGVICLEPFKFMPQMGRFTLRDENRTIAIGKVLKLVE